MRQPKTWAGSPPTKCNLCTTRITDTFYDASIPKFRGSWGILCPKCFLREGCPTGIGLGQKYTLQEDASFLKTEG